MKKHLFSIFFCFLAGIAFAEPFAVRVNGKTDYPAIALGDKDFQERTQYCAYCVPLQAGDVITCYDEATQAEWAITVIDPYGEYEKFLTAEGGVVCSVSGDYDVYIKLKFEDDLIYIAEATNCSEIPVDSVDPEDSKDPEDYPDIPINYATSVPENCPDVMLQAFYWDSYDASKNKTYGDTKWATLNAQASEIAAYFDLVWLPPSAKSSGGVGYHPAQYSNQNSAWGTRVELENFITSMHAANTKVIADIVINHAANVSSWCDFYTNDFSPYGVFSPDVAWICNTDEVNTASSGACKGKATGASDQGYLGEANYGAARDWDHTNPEVQAMFEAYLKWMKHEMKYDGWRYDYCKGFKGKYINQYNKAAANYFSVTEFWDGNPTTLQSYLNDCANNTLTFDFATKYTAFNQGIAAGNYTKLKGAGLPGRGLAKYAVTFVDSHDTFDRNNGSEFSKEKAKILQANAYLLAMPGVPCVFYPHWKLYKANIGKMILARQAAGVHSQSAVSDEAGSGYYKATITGTNGEIRLLLGPNSGYDATPAGYTLADKGTNYGVYYKTNNPVAPRLIVTPGSQTFKDPAGITVTMTTVGGSATNMIYYTLDGSDPKTSDTRQQYTAPITITQTTTLNAYAEANGAKTAVQTYTYTYKEPQTTPIIVRFYKPADWAKLNLYAWVKDATGKVTELTGKWPGTEMTVQDSEGWYYHQFDASIKEVNFIFNNGTVQTSDLWTDEDVCYSWSGGAEKLEEDCAVTAVEDIEMNPSTHAAQKVLINNQLYIRQGQQIYTILGTPIK